MANSFQIVLNNFGATYTAGDVVSGRVVLTSTEDLTVKTVRISFIGRSKTKLIKREEESQKIRRGDVSFFRYHKLLYSSQYKLKANVYSWPFEFTLPSQADPSLGERIFNNCPPFLGFGMAYPLPPALDCYTGESKGKVEYKLQAMLIHDNSSTLEHECLLKYMPLRSEATTNISPLYYFDASYTARTLRLLPDKQELKFKEKMHNFFKSDTLPSATFVLRTSYPSVTYLNQQLPVKIAIVNLNRSDEVTSEPNIYVTRLAIKIKSSYMFRTGSGLNTKTTGSNEREHTLFLNNDMRMVVPYACENDTSNTSRDEKMQLGVSSGAVVDPSFISSTKMEQLDLGSLTPHGRFQTPNLPPTFKTPNIAVNHRLKIKIRLDCAGRPFDFERNTHLTVLPPKAQAVDRNGNLQPLISRQADLSGSSFHSSSLAAPNVPTSSRSNLQNFVEQPLPLYTKHADLDTVVVETGMPDHPPTYNREDK
jgi:hypothetical protein